VSKVAKSTVDRGPSLACCSIPISRIVFVPFYTKVTDANVRDATHVLDHYEGKSAGAIPLILEGLVSDLAKAVKE
jgi:hypothetical protein